MRVRSLFISIAALLSALGSYAQIVKPPQWVGSWAASQQIPTDMNIAPKGQLEAATLRQIVHLSLGGEEIRLRLSNVFGTSSLGLMSVHVARPVSASGAVIDFATDRVVTFDRGHTSVIIPSGAEYLSDPVPFHAAALSDIAITITYDQEPATQTAHPGSRSTSYVLHGVDASTAEMEGAAHFDRWYQIAGVDVPAPTGAASIVTFGDSITDGHGATTNGNDRWPDDLAVRLQSDPALRNLGVLNAGLGGNRVLVDGSGPNALARFSRDVLVQPGAKYVVVFEGVNDLGMTARLQEFSPRAHDALVASILGAYQQMIDLAHDRGLRIYGATITPFLGFDFYHPNAANEADRQKINAWIRAAGHFDAVIDFDKVIADPADPTRLLPKFDSGDHLHPSASGFHAMADSISLDLFRR
ncbi:SGNH/GDSL hydrolase family protein [Terriglobus roseus]|uniref:Lysophospholipase L1 n=1 Tax=Terriglobus roseus TaxID=392734 RepID=A0A1H4NZU8_9BACT|nr:SGNH/GDSL hydrolase family protein [Terriglobus roseus]SEC00751.1 Lysophospholipase L1 [Terriglobus roseus]